MDIKEYNIGIVIADDEEYRPIYQMQEELSATESDYNGRVMHRFVIEEGKNRANVTTLWSNTGKVNAAVAATYLAENGCQIILNCGLSGGISKEVSKGDIMFPNRFLEHDFDLTMIGYKPCEKPLQEYIYSSDEKLTELFKELIPSAKTGTAVSGDCFVCDEDLKNFLKENFNATSCDMETAAIAYVCYSYGIPFFSIRKISDDAGEDAGTTYRKLNVLAESELVEILIMGIRKLLKD